MALEAPPFGRDTSWTDAPKWGRMASGGRLVAEAGVRRLRSTRSTLLYDPNYGLALVDLLGSELTPQQEAAIPSRIRSELRKDERIEEVKVHLSKERVGTSIAFFVDVEFETAEGPFEFAFSVQDGVLTVLRLPEAA